MNDLTEVGVLFVSGFGPIVKEPDASSRFYIDTLGLPLEAHTNGVAGYFHSEKLSGVRHFALWPLAAAAHSCFGTETWPASVREPCAWMEFDVKDVAVAAAALKRRGYSLLVDYRQEPWGQTVSRMLSPEGILVGLVVTPWMR
jgi:catechol 2,3-dioxygenase-like lactoylglutathione lyase family enzyme